VQRGEELRATRVYDGEPRSPLGERELRDAARERGQRADSGDRLRERLPDRPGGRDPDAKTRVRAGTDPDGDQVDSLPSTRLTGGPLHLAEQLLGMSGTGAGGRGEEPLANALVAARRRDGEIRG
jgi:hypothetical protein